MDMFEDYDKRKKMLDKFIMKKYPDFSTEAGSGDARREAQFGFGKDTIFGPNYVIPEGTKLPINPNNPNLISRDVNLNDSQRALGLNILENAPSGLGASKPPVVGPLTDFKQFGGIKSIIGDAMYANNKIGISSKDAQQSKINTQFYNERKYVVNPNNAKVLFDSESKDEIKTTLANVEALGVSNAIVMNREELQNFRKSLASEETTDSFARRIPTDEIIQSSLIATTESGRVDPLSEIVTNQIRFALNPLDQDDRTFDEIKNSYDQNIQGKRFNYQLYDANGKALSEEDQNEIYGVGIENPYVPIPDNFNVDYASAGDLKGLAGRSMSGLFNFFGAEAPANFARQTTANQASFDGLLQPILWFRARALMPKPTSKEIDQQRLLLPSFNKNDFKNASLTKTAIVDMQSKLRNALQKRENIKNNVTGGKLEEYDQALIDQAPAMIELLKAMYKQFEEQGTTGQGARQKSYELNPVVPNRG
jgi:hypothetical protein